MSETSVCVAVNTGTAPSMMKTESANLYAVMLNFVHMTSKNASSKLQHCVGRHQLGAVTAVAWYTEKCSLVH